VEAKSIPTTFAINGAKAKAVDYAYRMAEEDFGLTNMKDNLREGDVAAMAPSRPQTAEAEALVREMTEAIPELSPEQAEASKHFWQTGEMTPSAAPDPGEVIKQQYVDMAKMNAAQTRDDGLDPVGLLHKAGKEGHLAPKYDVVGRAKAADVT
jgi:hypothetical protein